MLTIGIFCKNASKETEILRKTIFQVFGEITIMCADDCDDNKSASEISYDKANFYDILIVNQPPALVNKVSYSCEAAVVNTDDKSIVSRLTMADTETVTYGFNSKASVTASSVIDDKILFCVQRSFLTLSKKTVIQQEFSVSSLLFTEWFGGDCSLIAQNAVLPVVTAALIADVSANEIAERLTFNRALGQLHI
ncbi:hypothetical protein FACS189490_05440 [Clostridia bacterium]|nr:hypothetical protein FACS189490_05440 [Clostridia bacterium]